MHCCTKYTYIIFLPNTKLKLHICVTSDLTMTRIVAATILMTLVLRDCENKALRLRLRYYSKNNEIPRLFKWATFRGIARLRLREIFPYHLLIKTYSKGRGHGSVISIFGRIKWTNAYPFYYFPRLVWMLPSYSKHSRHPPSKSSVFIF